MVEDIENRGILFIVKVLRNRIREYMVEDMGSTVRVFYVW